MDISNIQRYLDSNLYSSFLSKKIIDEKNRMKNKEKLSEDKLSDFFKTLREPLLKQQKESIERQDTFNQQQDEMIAELKDNQREILENIRRFEPGNVRLIEDLRRIIEEQRADQLNLFRRFIDEQESSRDRIMDRVNYSIEVMEEQKDLFENMRLDQRNIQETLETQQDYQRDLMTQIDRMREETDEIIEQQTQNLETVIENEMRDIILEQSAAKDELSQQIVEKQRI